MLAFLRRQIALLRTPVGRARIARDYFNGAWHILRFTAKAYRAAMLRRTRLVAVVGSQGKTTTARAVAAALGLVDNPARENIGNCYSHIALAVLRVRPRDDYAVLEVGIAHKKQMQRYARIIQPDITVVTSISSEHNSSFGDLGVTRWEKAAMVRALPPSGLVVLNGDDPNVLWMRGQTRARVVTYGFSPACDVYAADAAFDWPAGMRFRLHVTGTVREARTRLIGRVYIYSILAAVAVGIEAGLSLDALLAALEHLAPTPGRLAPVRLASGAILLCDEFKSSLETIDAALDVLAEIPARRKIVVLGEVSEPPGKTGPIYRHLGGRIAGMANRAVFLGSSKSCQAYAAGAAKEGMPREALSKVGRSLEQAVAAIPADLGEGDVVLIKGRCNQRLGRIALTLMGREVRCDIPTCPVLNTIDCDRCKMLERGWQGLRVEA